MCLSSVYKNEKAEENLLASDVASIEAEDGTVTLTDLFGRRLSVRGTLKRADLTGGVVILRVESCEASA